MSAKRSAAPRAALPALLIDGRTESVISLNRPARELLGEGTGRPCWRVVGALEPAGSLPCARGCSRERIRGGLERPREAPVRLGSEWRTLVCVAVKDVVVCVLGGRPSASPARPILTSREIEVMRLLAEGADTSDIARRLGLATGTVRTHVENMRTKLGAATRAGLVARALRLGLIE